LVHVDGLKIIRSGWRAMDTRINLRTTEEIKNMLQELCEDDGRTLTAEIEKLIKERYKTKDLRELKTFH